MNWNAWPGVVRHISFGKEEDYQIIVTALLFPDDAGGGF